MRAEAVPPYVEFRLQLTTRNLQPICTADGNGVNLKHGDFSASYHVWFRSKDSAPSQRMSKATSAATEVCSFQAAMRSSP